MKILSMSLPRPVQIRLATRLFKDADIRESGNDLVITHPINDKPVNMVAFRRDFECYIDVFDQDDGKQTRPRVGLFDRLNPGQLLSARDLIDGRAVK